MRDRKPSESAGSGRIGAPRVRVVVVNYEGGDLTQRCLDSLEQVDWPSDAIEIVVVDNASRDGSDGLVEGRSGVRLLRAPSNLGFGGAVNLALAELGDTEYVALVNNDAMVSPGWLRPLVDALDRAPRAGAACPKILFAGTFATVRIETETHQRGRGDHRNVGVRVEGVRIDGRDCGEQTQFASGFHGPERQGGRSFEWTADAAVLHVPLVAASTGAEAELLLSSDQPKVVTLDGRATRKQVPVDRRPRWVSVAVVPLEVPLLNSVGGIALEDGYGSDRGYLEPDCGQYDEPEEVFGWSGCAVLLRRSYLDDVGVFDDSLFLYYEDFDLSWRGRGRGWRYAYVPASTVSHVHGASANKDRWRAERHKERNRLVVHTKNAPGSYLPRVYGNAVRGLGLHLIRDIWSRGLHGERPHVGYVAMRARALLGFARASPRALRARSGIRGAQTATDEELLAWVAPRSEQPLVERTWYVDSVGGRVSHRRRV
jgi:GT2 family glycosyltransferase